MSQEPAPATPQPARFAGYHVTVADPAELERLVARLQSAEHPPAEVKRLRAPTPESDYAWFDATWGYRFFEKGSGTDVDGDDVNDLPLQDGGGVARESEAATATATRRAPVTDERVATVDNDLGDSQMGRRQDTSFGEGQSTEYYGRTTQPAAVEDDIMVEQSEDFARSTATQPTLDRSLMDYDLRAGIPLEPTTTRGVHANQPAAVRMSSSSEPADAGDTDASPNYSTFAHLGLIAQPAAETILLLYVRFETPGTQPAPITAPATETTQPAAETQPDESTTQPASATP